MTEPPLPGGSYTLANGIARKQEGEITFCERCVRHSSLEDRPASAGVELGRR